MIISKKLSVIAILVTVVIVASSAGDKPEERFKNLKVLPKNTTHQELKAIMSEFKTSLGVKCDYCHVESGDEHKLDFVSDAKPEKDMARSMMRMTLKLNKKYFKVRRPQFGSELEVSCNTCHHGQPHPEEAPHN